MLRRAVAGALITVGLLAAGCSDDDGDEGGTTTTESTTTTTEDWTVPDEIDEEYVERVLNELYQMIGEGCAADWMAAESMSRVEAIYEAVYEPLTAEQFIDAARSNPRARRTPGPARRRRRR